MQPTIVGAFFDELEKIAKTRAQKEWMKEQVLQKAKGVLGHTKFQNEIAEAYGNLKLAPRYLDDISKGGEEAGVDLMMGAVNNKKMTGGYAVRKMYKPDSPHHRGEGTRRILDWKQERTDYIRNNLGKPEYIADMAGYKEVQPGRFVSFHEYIPGALNVPEDMAGREKFKKDHQQVYKRIYEQVVEPAKMHGKRIDDVVRPMGHGWGDGPYEPNVGNIAVLKNGDQERGVITDFSPRMQDKSWEKTFVGGPSVDGSRSPLKKKEYLGKLRKNVYAKPFGVGTNATQCSPQVSGLPSTQ